MFPLTYVPLNGRIVFEGVDIHPKNSGHKCERQEDKCNPAQSPYARVKLKGEPSIPNSDRFVYLGFPSLGLHIHEKVCGVCE
jgi:hypothetical protein